MEVNYLAVLVCAVLSMVVGAVWYGPLFGKKWMDICEVDANDLEARKKMQKEAAPLYAIQFLLVLFQVWVMAGFMGGSLGTTENALWIWAAFIMPTIAGSSMWTNEKNNMKLARFLIQSGYQLVMFAIFGFVLGIWR